MLLQGGEADMRMSGDVTRSRGRQEDIRYVTRGRAGGRISSAVTEGRGRQEDVRCCYRE